MVVAGFGVQPIGVQAAGSGDLTVDQVRSEFITDGFNAGTPSTWWGASAPISFRVTDPNSDRVIMVLVYPDSLAAASARDHAQGQEASDQGRLVPGYGLSTWVRNVAIVESTGADLARMYQTALDQDNEVAIGEPGLAVSMPSQPTYAVDADLVGVVDNVTANL